MTLITIERPRDLTLSIDQQGAGRPVLVIHGGGGPRTVAPLVAHLAEHHRVLAPTIPGWEGTPRPDWLASVADLADAITGWLADADLRDAIVVGSSVGGWVASELAIRDEPAVRDRGLGRIAGVALLDGTGVDVAGHPMRDFFSLDPRGVAEYSWHDPARGFIDPAALTDAQRRTMAANMSTLRLIAGEGMHDPTLLGRLGRVDIPALAIWGDSDRIVTPDYGRAYAAAFGNGRFELIRDAGHLPHLEQPEATFAVLDAWLDEL